MVKTSIVNYALPKQQKAFTNLKVSYNGRTYEELSYHEINIENISQRVVNSAPFIITLSKDAQILDKNISCEPIKHNVIYNQDELEPNQHRYILEDLHPGDNCKVQLMVQKGTSLSWLFRGSDNVEVTSSNGELSQIFEDELRQIIFMLALYVMVGFIPLFADVLRGALIVSSSPYLYRVFSQWRTSLSQKKNGVVYGPIIMSDSGSIKLSYDPDSGASSVKADFSKGQKYTNQKRKQSK
jgi:hypothetical protein